MARSKKAKKAKAAAPYFRRLVEDERVHGHLRDAAGGVRQAYGRVSRKRGRATEDKKLYADLGGAAASIRQAALAIRQPPKPKRGGRKLLVAALAAAGAAVAYKRGGREKLESALSDGPAGDDQAAQAGDTTSPLSEPNRPKEGIRG